MLKNLLLPLDKSINAVASNRNNISKRCHYSEKYVWTISNEEMNNIMKIVNSLEVSGFFINGVSGIIPTIYQYVIKYTRCWFIKKFICR